MEPRTIDDLPDDVLRRILLRLDTSLWLIRAAIVSKRWRRAVTDGGRTFLRLASSLHPPTVAGQYHTLIGGGHRFVPSSSSIDGSRFSEFPPAVNQLRDRYACLQVADCHGGLVLLSTSSAPSSNGLIVYDPLTRKHRWISRAPAAFSIVREVFLLDGDDGHISISNFKVLHRSLNAAAAVFSRGNNAGREEWDWRFLSRGLSGEDLFFPGCSLYAAGRVDGSLYLGFKNGGRMIIAFDSTSLVFSMVDLPARINTPRSPAWSSSSFTVVVHGASASDFDRSTSLVHVCGEELELFRRTVQGSGEWVLEHTIANLSEAAARCLSAVCLEKMKGIAWSTMAAGVNADNNAACAILLARSDTYRYRFFSIDVDTMELRVLPQETYRQTKSIFNYTCHGLGS